MGFQTANIDGTRWYSVKGYPTAWRIVGPAWFLRLLWTLYQRDRDWLRLPTKFLGDLVGARIEYADKKHMPPDDRQFADFAQNREGKDVD